MSDVRIELDSAGVREMLQSAEAMEICKEIADKAQSKLGEGYEVTAQTGKYRAQVRITTESYRAMASNLKHNSLLKAIGQG
jgi:hypothetical protein